jgi:hypothetical protein
VLREDESGGFAGLPPQTQYHTENYIKLGAITFVSATAVQLLIGYRKRAAAHKEQGSNP